SRSAMPISATEPGAPPVRASSSEPEPEVELELELELGAVDPVDVPAVPDAPRFGVWLRPPFPWPWPEDARGAAFFFAGVLVCEEPKGSWYCWSPAPLPPWAAAVAGTAPAASEATVSSMTRRREGSMRREA